MASALFGYSPAPEESFSQLVVQIQMLAQADKEAANTQINKLTSEAQSLKQTSQQLEQSVEVLKQDASRYKSQIEALTVEKTSLAAQLEQKSAELV